MNSLIYISIGMCFIIFLQYLKKKDTITISLYVLVDNSGRICYTGSYNDLKSKQTSELKLTKLTGVIK